MKCKYCGCLSSLDNKFYTVECCVECHNNGEDIEDEGEEEE